MEIPAVDVGDRVQVTSYPHGVRSTMTLFSAEMPGRTILQGGFVMWINLTPGHRL